ncbi:LCP family glycopolymer transferase [Salipaludibacillus neizhouensis]|uniref:LCP family glycopolymer transferase n=1 Tax=Salipaludibacillus neizhouensis TaxID=885475 RepID=UPI001CBA63A6|nr:LCP family protein [Salipaludibacillus neizhouensis]
MQSRIEHKQNKKRRKLRPFAKVLIFTVLAMFLAGGSVVAYFTHQIANVTNNSQQELERGDHSAFREVVADPSDDPVSVLFLGLDTRDGDLSGRTDAMILVTFNPDLGTIKMVNIPRDSKVPIIGRNEEDKINHAHAFGGVDMTIDTVENLLNIPVDYHVSLNFDAFMEIIDELGGIQVDSPMAFTETDNATYGTLMIEEGEQVLNGEEALAYARMRKQDPAGDLGRGERQKEIIESVIREMATLSSLTNFNSLMGTVERNLSTNVNFSNIVSMHSYANELDNIESLHFEGTDLTENGIWYYQINDASLLEISEELQEHLGMEDKTYVSEDSDADDETEETSIHP